MKQVRIICCIFFLILCISKPLLAQKEWNNWIFGNGAWLDFNGSIPISLPGAKINTLEGCASYSDPCTGKLLLYTDGVQVWDSNHRIIENGTGLLGGASSAQNVAFIANPANPNQVYLFTVADRTSLINRFTTDFHYNIVENKNGNWVIVSKNSKLEEDVAEAIAITGNPFSGYMIAVYSNKLEKLLFYQLDKRNLIRMGEYPAQQGVFTLKFSKSGKYLAWSNSKNPTISVMKLHEIKYTEKNNELIIDTVITGIGSTRLIHESVTYSIQFSPDESFLYTSSYNNIDKNRKTSFYSLDIKLLHKDSIENAIYLIYVDNSCFSAGIQIARNGKLYISPYQFPETFINYLHCINNPNKGGAECGFQEKAIILSSGSCWAGLPTINASLYNFSDSSRVFEETVYKVCGKQYAQIGLLRQPGYRYRWVPGKAFADSTLPMQTVIVDKSISYRLIVEADGGCISEYPCRFEYQPMPENPAGPDQISCSGSGAFIGSDALAGYTYSWSPIEGLGSPDKSRTLCLPTKPMTYYLTVTGPGGCISYDTVQVNVGIAPKLTVNLKDTILCAGESVQLNASGALRYRWSPERGLDSATGAQVIAKPDTSTLYTVYGDNNGCIDSAQIFIRIIPQPRADAGADKFTCVGGNVILGSAARPGLRYKWIPGLYLSDSTAAQPICTPLANQQYIVQVFNQQNCMQSDTVQVNLGGTLSLEISKDTTICAGGSVTLFAKNADEYNWSPATGLNRTDSSVVIANPEQTTLYTVQGKSGSCQGSAQILITVQPKPVLQLSGNTTLCIGNSTILQAKGADEYTWSPATGLNRTDSSIVIANPDQTTIYTVTATKNNCTISDTIGVYILPKPQLKITKDTTLCAGSSLQLQAEGAQQYRWSPATGLNNANIFNPIASPDSTTLYTVIGYNGDCADTAQILITIIPQPILKVSADTSICSGDSVQLFANGAQEYNWSPATGLNRTDSNVVIASPITTTTYIVTGKNAICSTQKQVTVTILAPQEQSIRIESAGEYLPGEQAKIKINIPAIIQKGRLRIIADSCCISFLNLETTAPYREIRRSRSELLIEINSGGEIILPAIVYLPPDGRKQEQIQIAIDSIEYTIPCQRLSTASAMSNITYSSACAWSIRGIMGSGKSYRAYIHPEADKCTIESALDGSIEYSLSSITGNTLIQSSYYSVAGTYQTIDLPKLSTGLYILSVRSGLWQERIVFLKGEQIGGVGK